MRQRFLVTVVLIVLLPLLLWGVLKMPGLRVAASPAVALPRADMLAAQPAATSSVVTPSATTAAVTTTVPLSPTGAASSTVTTTAPLPVPPEAVLALEGTFERIYSAVSPSVVNIRVSGTNLGGGMAPFGQGPMRPNTRIQTALGSGFVWDTQGHIVTNNHVVEGASNISVTFSDGTTVTATVSGQDINSDLAVLKVNAPARLLRPVSVGDSDKLRVGQLVIAIGNPFGLQGSMSTGIVSALARSLPVGNDNMMVTGPSYSIPDVIQTDAAINPGNSGGVLIDATGQVVGVPSAMESAVGASSGVGFAIPSLIVQKVAPALISGGAYRWPYIGITGTDLTPEVAQAMNLPAGQRGALVIDVASNGPADKAGIHGSSGEATVQGEQIPVGGDVITAVDSAAIRSFDDLVAYLARDTQVGQTVTLTVLRDGKEQAVEVTLAARPATSIPGPGATPAPRSGGGSATPAAGGVRLGVLIVDVTPDIATAMNLPANQAGVLIESVQSGSPADQAGLRGGARSVTVGGQQILAGGDIITALNGRVVANSAQLRAALQGIQPGSDATLAILREGQPQNVTVHFAAGGAATPTPAATP